MKTTNYRFQTILEHLGSPSGEKYFKEYLKELLESNKPYYQKSDYIALGFMELDSKIEYLSNEAKAITALKNKLQEARVLGQEIVAQVLSSYGIDKLEGATISSLTITPQKTKTKDTLLIKDPDKVMELGYVDFVVDERGLKDAIKDPKLFALVDPYIEVSTQEATTPARLKINKRRSNGDTATPTAETIEPLPTHREAA